MRNMYYKMLHTDGPMLQKLLAMVAALAGGETQANENVLLLNVAE